MQLRKLSMLFRGEIRYFFLKLFGRDVRKKGFALMSRRSSFLVKKGSHCSLGNKVSLESGSFLAVVDGGHLEIGDQCYINRNCSIVAQDRIVLEDGVTIGPNCCIYDHDHDYRNQGQYLTKPIHIKKGAWIGSGCVLLKGVTVGEGAVVAAGTVLKTDVPDHTIVYSPKEYRFKPIEH